MTGLTKQCSVPDCEKPHHSHGYCRNHARRWKKHGAPLAGRTPHGEPLKWMQRALKKETVECIEWPFATAGRNYGVFSLDGRQTYAHRHVCQTAHGKPPSSTSEAAHSCGNSLCCNKEHLRWATPHENAADRIEHGTSNRGEKHGMSKLKPSDVQEIRVLLKAAVTQRVIADQFGVQVMAISNINRGVTWSHLEVSS